MSAEGKPPVQISRLAQPMVGIMRLVLQAPALVAAVSVALSIFAGIYAYKNLGYRTNRLDLLNPNSRYNQLWVEYLKEFGDDDDAVVVVEGDSRDKLAPVLQELAAALRREPRLFSSVHHEIDLSKLRAKGLHYLAVKDLHDIEAFLQETAPIVAGNWTQLKVSNMAGALAMRLQATAGAAPRMATAIGEQLDRFAESLLVSLSRATEFQYKSPWPGMPEEFARLSEPSNEFLMKGKFGFILLRLAPGEDKFARCSEATTALRRLIAGVAQRHKDVKIGLTGLPVVEHDEMRSSQVSMAWAEVLSFAGVVLILIAAFGGFRHALLANFVLLIAIAWTFAYAALVVGHLNILSVAFTVTLNGLGIDYGVYYSIRYVRLREMGHSCDEALLEAIGSVGPAIMIGALTTAAGFFVAVLTSFTGVAELGIIAGGGILLCAVAQLFVLPAFICLLDRGTYFQSVPRMLSIHGWFRPITASPRFVLTITTAATLIIGVGIVGIWYDHNLLNMQARGLESVELERRLLNECDRSMWFAISVADSPEELLRRRDAFKKLDSVQDTEEIVQLFPEDVDQKQPVIARIQQRLAALPERPPLIAVDPMENLGVALAQTQGIVGNLPAGASAARQLEQIRDTLRRRTPTECYQVLSRFQQEMAGEMLTRLHLLRAAANPEPPQLTDLPSGVIDRFVGRNGKHLLKIYGRGDIWDMEGLKKFVHDVRSVDPKATGNPLQAYEASLEMKASYEQAAIYALLVIVAVLFVDFNSVRWTLLSMLSTGVGVLQMFGLLGLLNVPLNAANLIALPIILGVGVDYGLHVVHDFRAQSGRYSISPSTALGVLVDGLTTVVGFGAFMIADHQGLQSLGRVLTIGTSCCMFTALVMLPALFTLATWNRAEQPAADEAEGEGETVASTGDHTRSPDFSKPLDAGAELPDKLPLTPRPRFVDRQAA